MIDKRFEYILCAAIHVDDGKHYEHQPKNISSGIVICGRRHHNCFIPISKIWPDVNAYKKTQGFLSSHDKFYNREEAYIIAKKNGQLQFDDDNGRTLLSEDIY